MLLFVGERCGGMNKHKFTILILMSPLPLIVALIVLHFQAAGLWSNAQTNQSLPDRNRAKVADSDGQAITSLTLSPATLPGGNSSIATLNLRRPAPAGGAVVMLAQSNSPAVRLPTSVTVQPGTTSATFTIATSKVATFTTINLTVSYEDQTHTDTLTVLPPAGREWYVAPDGSPRGKGTLNSPWDMATALAGGTGGIEIKPGETVWLRGGRYTGAYTSTLQGTADAPIIVRAFPGERAVLDRAGVSEAKQPALKVKGAWVWFWGFEVMNSHPDRSRVSPYTGKDEPWRGSGADVYAAHVKFINMIFHDNGHGIWDKQDMTEIHGCLFSHNGNNKREHALYLGNTNGTKYVTDNLIFAQGGYGLLAHSNSPSSAQRGLHLEGNAVFNNGILTLDDQTTGNIQVGGVRGVSAERIVVKNNYVYNAPENAASKNNGIRLGYEDQNNRDVVITDNYIVSRTPLRLWWWQSIEFQGNTVYSDGESCELKTPAGASASAYRWNFNTYFSAQSGTPRLYKNSVSYDFTRWQQETGLDTLSREIKGDSARPREVQIFVRPNRYERGRAHIIVYNPNARAQVPVDLSSVLPAGAAYEVRDAQNYYGKSVARGTYNGSSIQLPTDLKDLAPPVGKVERAPTHSAPKFIVFVLQTIAT